MAPLSEVLGRRPVALVAGFGFAMFNLGAALSHNIETMLVCRFLAGCFAAAPLTNAGGEISKYKELLYGLFDKI